MEEDGEKKEVKEEGKEAKKKKKKKKYEEDEPLLTFRSSIYFVESHRNCKMIQILGANLERITEI